MSTTIKVSETTRDRVKAIGAQTNQPADAVVAEALDELERKLFWRRYAEQRAAVREPATEWDRASSDGLQAETWTDDDFS
jgi:hypothetical protein